MGLLFETETEEIPVRYSVLNTLFESLASRGHITQEILYNTALCQCHVFGSKVAA
jgi:hypothetical protein